MTNPFETENYKSGFPQQGFYSTFIKNQISKVNMGDSIKIDLGGNDLHACRSMIQYVSGKLKIKFKTKVYENELWIKRVE